MCSCPVFIVVDCLSAITSIKVNVIYIFGVFYGCLCALDRVSLLDLARPVLPKCSQFVFRSGVFLFSIWHRLHLHSQSKHFQKFRQGSSTYDALGIFSRLRIICLLSFVFCVFFCCWCCFLLLLSYATRHKIHYTSERCIQQNMCRFFSSLW